MLTFIDATVWKFYTLYKYEDCCLEDFNLLRTVSPKGIYMLKIETDTATYLSVRRGKKKTIRRNCEDAVDGTEEIHLIWIKCKDLKEFAVPSDENLYIWKPTFKLLQ